MFRLSSPVFIPGGNAATNMPFCFVLLQDLLHLTIQAGIDGRQPLLEILVYRAFGYTEGFGGTAYRGTVFNHV